MTSLLIAGVGILLASWAFFGAGTLPPASSADPASGVLGSAVARTWAPTQVLAACCGAALAWVALGGQLGVLAVPAGAAGGWIVLGKTLTATREKQRDAGRADFALALDLLASTLEAGSTIVGAATHVAAVIGGPNGRALSAVAALTSVGASPEQAWRTLEDHPYWADVSKELARCAHSGAASAKVLRVAATQERRTRAAKLSVKVREVGVRSSLPLVLCYLPAFLLLGVVPIIGGLVTQYL